MPFSTRFICLCFVMLTAFMTVAQEADSGYTVVEVIDLERLAGPVGTAVFMSPDGSQYAHVNRGAICLYSLPDNSEIGCYNFDGDIRPNLETGHWSPDGQFFALIDNEPLTYLEDADVQLLDIAAGEIRNVTDDEFEGNFFFNADADAVFGVDVAVTWSDDNQLTVLRYPYEDGENANNVARIVTVDPVAGESAVLVERELESPFAYWTITRSGNRIASAEAPFQRDTDIQSIDIFDAENGELLEEISLSESTEIVFSLQFSADDNFILAYNPAPRDTNTRFEPDYDGLVYIDLSDGTEHNLDEAHFVIQAGFAPEGNAIAYLVQNPFTPESGGLYIAPAIGEPAELVLQMERPDGTTPLSHAQLTWSSNNTIMIRDNTTTNAVLVVLEEN